MSPPPHAPPCRQLTVSTVAFQLKSKKWWEDAKLSPNVHHINSVQELVNAMGAAGDGLVIVGEAKKQHTHTKQDFHLCVLVVYVTGGDDARAGGGKCCCLLVVGGRAAAAAAVGPWQ